MARKRHIQNTTSVGQSCIYGLTSYNGRIIKNLWRSGQFQSDLKYLVQLSPSVFPRSYMHPALHNGEKERAPLKHGEMLNDHIE